MIKIHYKDNTFKTGWWVTWNALLTYTMHMVGLSSYKLHVSLDISRHNLGVFKSGVGIVLNLWLKVLSILFL